MAATHGAQGTEVYFGGDGCMTCGRATLPPWNRDHAEWCEAMQHRKPYSLARGAIPYGRAYEDRLGDVAGSRSTRR